MLFFIRTCVQENLIRYLFMFCQKIYVINLEMTLHMLYYLGMMMILFAVCYLGIYVVLMMILFDVVSGRYFLPK